MNLGEADAEHEDLITTDMERGGGWMGGYERADPKVPNLERPTGIQDGWEFILWQLRRRCQNGKRWR